MKSLREYIEKWDEEHGYFTERGSYVLHLEEEIINLLWPEGDCPPYIIEGIIDRRKYVDPILENLNTHDWKKVKKFLEKEYDVRVYKVNDNDDKKDGISIECNNIDDARYIVNDPKFKQCLKFYNYYFSEFNKKYLNVIMLEPIYSEKVSVHYNDPNHAIAYHVTSKVQGKEILRTGLRPKKGKYRYFPSRVYLILPDKYSEGIDCIKEVIERKELKKDDVCVLKINLGRIDEFNFYKDVAMENNQHNNYIYTYGYVHPSLIEDITEKIKHKI